MLRAAYAGPLLSFSELDFAMNEAFDWLTRAVAVPSWLLAILVTGWLLALALLVRRVSQRGAGDHDYRSDEIFGIRWRWRYRRDHPDALVPYCKKDDMEMVYHFDDVSGEVCYVCEQCGHSVGPFAGDHAYVCGMIGRQIEYRRRTGRKPAEKPAANAPKPPDIARPEASANEPADATRREAFPA